MTRTIAEMCAERDPLYAATRPAKWFATLRALDLLAAESHAASTETMDLAFMIAAIQRHPEFVRLKVAL